VGTSFSALKLAQLNTSTKCHATAPRIAVVIAAVDQPRHAAPANPAIVIRIMTILSVVAITN
jgi:hypothetical protein